jgi:serine/threonine-protein kinase
MEAATTGGYRVERVLSTRLGIHTVVQAIGPDGGRVAITLLDPAVADDPHLRRHVLRLARTRASIRHPNVLPLVGPHEVEDRIGLVSTLAGPCTLADRLARGPLDPAEAVSILCQVASALETAAAGGLVHRDLAPRSIVFGDEDSDQVFLGDFGITLPPLPGCELVDSAEGIDYCSPEEVRGEALEPESNVYSLACLLVECLTGAPPYSYDRPLLTLHAHVVEPPPRVSERRPELSKALDDVIARAMAKDPRERYRSPGRLMRAAAEALGVEATVPVLVPPRPPDAGRGPSRARAVARPRRRRTPIGIAIVAPTVALLGLVLGLVDWSGPPAPPPPDRPPAAAERARQTDQVKAVENAVERLAARRVVLRRELAGARRPAGQADAAGALAAAYGRTREALAKPSAYGEAREARAKPTVPVPAVAAIREALRDTERAYRRLAAAARERDRRAWRLGVRETRRRELQLERALRSAQAAPAPRG